MRVSTSPWPGVLRRLALLAAAGVLLGLIFDDIKLWMLIAAGVYLALHLFYLLRLERWLRRGARSEPPRGRGVWGEIFDRLYRYQRRLRERRQNLASQITSFRASANAMPDATIVLRSQGEMQWWNQAAKRLLALRWPEDEGQRIDNLIRHPEFRAYLDGEDERESVTLPSPTDPQTMLEIRVVPYGDGQRLLLARDITRLHKLERMRRDFVANISHELRTPLTVIRGLAETLVDGDEAQPPETRRALFLMEQQTERMRRLLDDLLLLSRLETEERRETATRVKVPHLLESLAEEARALTEPSGQTLTLEVDPELDLCGEASELRSAFENLLFNAVKYTPAGGSIHMRWYRDEAGAHFSVADTGVGVPARHLPRLTERFYRVDPGRHAATGGTGLGLAIVKHVLNRHEARLEVESTLGAGSTFHCHFPPQRLP